MQMSFGVFWKKGQDFFLPGQVVVSKTEDEKCL